MSIKTTSLGSSQDADEARDRLLARVAFEAIWVWDFERERISWEGNVKSIFGYERDEVVDLVGWWREHVHPDDREGVEEVAINATRSDSRGYSVEYRFRRRDGSWAWVASRCAIERDAGGRPVRAVGAMIDISTLKDTESRMRLFTEQLPARACATDRDLRVVWDTGAGFFDHPSVIGKTVSELFEQSPDRERVLEACQRALAGESCRLEIDDGKAAAQLDLTPFRDPAGDVIGVVGMAFDITDRIRTEQRIHAGQLLLQQVLDTLPVGVVVMDRAGDILLNNPSSRRIWGGTMASGRERWAKSKGSWHDSGQPIGAGEWASERTLEDGQTRLDELIDIETYDGQSKTIKNYSAPVRDGRGAITGALIVNEDVTARVRAEEELARRTRQLESLSRKLIEAQEAERRAVARELHDDLGQVLAALKLNLQRRGRRTTENIALVDGAIERMHDLAQALRPRLLDEFGLEASLRWYVKREAKRSGLRLHLALEKMEKRPPPAVETTCFRIVQEALTNVIRHAHASQLEVELSSADDAMLLLVRDDGQGFDIAAAARRAARGESQGLLNMEERAALAGGVLEINSEQGRGTSIRVRLPLVTTEALR